jgi:hypothetical protein
MSYGTHTTVRNGTEERLGLWPALEKARPAQGAERKPIVGESRAAASQGALPRHRLTQDSSGSWLMLPGASLARMTAQMGFDFVLVDCEHGNSRFIRSHDEQNEKLTPLLHKSPTPRCMRALEPSLLLDRRQLFGSQRPRTGWSSERWMQALMVFSVR